MNWFVCVSPNNKSTSYQINLKYSYIYNYVTASTLLRLLVEYILLHILLYKHHLSSNVLLKKNEKIIQDSLNARYLFFFGSIRPAF